MPRQSVYVYVRESSTDLVEAVKGMRKVRYAAAITGSFEYFLAVETSPATLGKVVHKLKEAGARGIETLIPMRPAMLKFTKVSRHASFVRIQAAAQQAESVFEKVSRADGVKGAALVAGQDVDVVAEVTGATPTEMRNRVMQLNGLPGVARSGTSIAMRQWGAEGEEPIS